MQDKKNIILSKCQDLIYEEVFKMPYEKDQNIYTTNQINDKIDAYLTDLIKKGELFYGEKFTEKFVNLKTDNDRIILIDKLKQDIDNNKTDITSKGETLNDFDNKELDIEEVKEKPTYEHLFNKLLDCGMNSDMANNFIAKYTRYDDIRKRALEEIAKTNELKTTDIKPVKTNDLKTAEMKPVKTKEPKKSLLAKFKEKWQNPKFRKKVIIGGVAIALGVALIALNPDFQNFISQIFQNPDINPDISSSITNPTYSAADIAQHSLDAVENVSPVASFDMDGADVYTNAFDAVNNTNNVVANPDFSDNLQGFYDTSSKEMLNVSAEDLQNADKIKEILANDDIAAVYGKGEINTLNDVSGFVNGDNVIDMINQGRSR